MRTAAVTVLALVGGFFVGISLSETIGIAGFLLFDSLAGFRFLPIVSAVDGEDPTCIQPAFPPSGDDPALASQ